jgi:hypothetical protein
MTAWEQLRDMGQRLRRGGSVAARQEAWLLRCLARNRDTAYGRSYGFGEIRSAEEYRERVPLVSYDDLAPRISQMERGERDVLFAGLPVAFERTGGSTGGNKLIPYSAASLDDFRAAILPWLANTISTTGLENGCAYWAISPATRGIEYTLGGVAIGLPDGAYLGEDALPAFAALSAVPPWVGGIPKVADWQLATLYWLVRRNDLALISVWSPTFLLELLTGLNQRHHSVEQLLREGGSISGQALPPDTAAADRLLAYSRSRDTHILWPDLRLISCWADASSKPFFEELERRLPHSSFQGKGLLATEGVVTIPNRDGAAVVAADSGFFEFLDDGGSSWLAHELKEGRRYEVIMTTAGGLYRYRIGDRVICEGYAETLPKLRFVGRCGLTSDLVGEKLTDEFVADCLSGIPGFRMLVPALEPRPRYVLIMDAASATIPDSLKHSIEERLKRNPQYAYARAIGQLDELSLLKAIEPLATYIKHVVGLGVRLGDVKVPALRPETDWVSTFAASRAATADFVRM